MRLMNAQRFHLLACVLNVVAVIVAFACLDHMVSARQVAIPVGIDDALQPDFVRRDLKTFETDLKLTAEQIPVVESLFNDYEIAFRTGTVAVREKVARIPPDMGFDDPDSDRKREEIKERIARLIEETHKAGEVLPADVDPEEFRKQAMARMASLRQELMNLQPTSSLPPEEIKKVMDQAATATDAWLVAKARLRDDFIADVQALLDDNQRLRWPPMSRKLTRQKTIGSGRLSGESIDLVLLVGELKPDDAAMQAIAEELTNYEINLDAALLRRNEALLTLQRDLILAMQANDLHRSQSYVEQQTALRTAVRDVNENYAPILADKLKPALGPKLLENYRTRGYSRVYRSTQTQRLFKAALELEGLELASQKAVEDLERAYLSEMVPMNEHLYQVVKASEPDEFNQRLRRRWAGADGQPLTLLPNRIQEGMAKKSELDQRYAKQLEGLLTPELFQKLPTGAVAKAPAVVVPTVASEPKPPSLPTGGNTRIPESLEDRKALVRRFDANGDGELDEAEMAALQAYLDPK